MSIKRGATGWSVEVFFDGECPLCRREIRMLQWLDRHGNIRFTDIATPNFDPGSVGMDHGQLMAEIHGRLPDGTWICGVEVFRQLYDAVGFGPFVLLSRAPIVSQVLNFGYRIFAKNRLKWTGRCSTRGGTCSPVKTSRPVKDGLAPGEPA